MEAVAIKAPVVAECAVLEYRSHDRGGRDFGAARHVPEARGWLNDRSQEVISSLLPSGLNSDVVRPIPNSAGS